VNDRGGITRLRCLHARRDTEVKIEVHFSDRIDDPSPSWRYVLGFKPEGRGAQRLMVTTEEVWQGENDILIRPDSQDLEDQQLLTETHLEQTRANGRFREIAVFFSNVMYLHLVPQLLKFGDKIGGNRLENDPFGQGFLEQIASCQKITRDARLAKIARVLSVAVPQFKELRFKADEISGAPHLEALYEHHRPHTGWQMENHFSDGTLRLLGILWSLLSGDALLLIEEPELSLHQAVVEQIPLLFHRVQRLTKRRRQIIVSTHSEALLSNKGIDERGVIVLEPGQEGTKIRPLNDAERKGLASGLSVADVVLPQTRPKKLDQLGLWR
jgi:predicted ATPase